MLLDGNSPKANTVKRRCTDTRYTDNLHITIENSAPKIYIEKFPRYTDKL